MISVFYTKIYLKIIMDFLIFDGLKFIYHRNPAYGRFTLSLQLNLFWPNSSWYIGIRMIKYMGFRRKNLRE